MLRKMADSLIGPVVGGSRRASVLTASTTFEEILCRLRGRGNPPAPRCKPGTAGGPLDGACRAQWTVTPGDREAADLFFNGRGGYRAAYSVSVRCGEGANRVALEFFSSWLRDYTGVPVLAARSDASEYKSALTLPIASPYAIEKCLNRRAGSARPGQATSPCALAPGACLHAEIERTHDSRSPT
jgi:hypothetical protein